MAEPLLLHIEGLIAPIAFNRPERRNAITFGLPGTPVGCYRKMWRKERNTLWNLGYACRIMASQLILSAFLAWREAPKSWGLPQYG